MYVMSFNVEILDTPQAVLWNDQLTGFLKTQRDPATPLVPRC